ncbi:MAG: tetratricopeptide repeat protein [Mariprofundales bacterium]|nr:tetratricopeptide repeat protein [Mariprofundales bacterium]
MLVCSRLVHSRLVFSRRRLGCTLLLFALFCPLLAAAEESWIDDGWQLLADRQSQQREEEQFAAALQVWQRGVASIAADRVLLAPVGIYQASANALRAVKRLGSELRGLVVQGRYHGVPSYFVLSLPPPGELEQFRTRFEQLLSGGKHRVYGWSAGRFQRGGSLAVVTDDLPAQADAPPAQAAMVVRSHPAAGREATAEEVAQRLMEMAKEAQAGGDRKRAILLLTELLKRTPEHARARLMSGRLMVQDGQYEAAWQVMQPLLKRESLDWKPWFWSGTAELMVGRLSEAARQFDEALARDGRVAAVWVHRALVAQQRGRYKVAYQLLRGAEKESPKSGQVMLNMVVTLDALCRVESASGYYRRYLVRTAGVASQWQVRKVVLQRLAELG